MRVRRTQQGVIYAQRVNAASNVDKKAMHEQHCTCDNVTVCAECEVCMEQGPIQQMAQQERPKCMFANLGELPVRREALRGVCFRRRLRLPEKITGL